MRLGKKEQRCALTADCGPINIMIWPLDDLPVIRNGVIVNNSEEHHCLRLHPPPLEICRHGCNAAGSTVVRAALR